MKLSSLEKIAAALQDAGVRYLKETAGREKDREDVRQLRLLQEDSRDE